MAVVLTTAILPLEKIMKTLSAIILLFIFSVPLASGQVAIDVESGYTSNLFSNYTDQQDYYTTLTGGYSRTWLTERQGWRGGYQGAWQLFNTFKERNTLTHELGADYYRHWRDGRVQWNSGLTFDLSQHTQDYQWYDRQKLMLYGVLRGVVNPHCFVHLGLNAQYQHYPELVPFDNLQMAAFARMSRSFESGTSIFLETNLLGKRYSSSASSASALSAEMATLGGGTALQSVSLLRLGQSISSSTGARLEFMLRRNVQNSTRYLFGQEGFAISDEELFDDYFGYEGEEWTASLKKILPWSMQANLGGKWMDKRYTQRLALDLEGLSFADGRLRRDRREQIWISLQKSLRWSPTSTPLILAAELTFWKNSSNDPFYDYHSTFWSFGISRSF